jgi:uncharacterized protein
MNIYDFVYLALYAIGGEIKGKTKFQKTIYFLGILTGRLSDLGYRPHYYGPYSEDVAAALERMRALGFVEQSISSGCAIDSRGFEVARYDYTLNKTGKEVAELKIKEFQDLWRKIQKAALTFRKLDDVDYIKMSIAAKSYFLLGEKKGKAKLTELSETASDFGWSVSVDEVRDAIRMLESLKLVKLEN